MQQGAPEPGADLRADGLRFALVVSRFNGFVTSRLCAAAVETLVGRGAARDAIAVHDVPGSFEIRDTRGEVAVAHIVSGPRRGRIVHFEKNQFLRA